MIKRRTWWAFATYLFLTWVVLGGIIGCQSMGTLHGRKSSIKAETAVERQVRLAMNAYDMADYQTAATIFAAVKDQSEDAVISRKALYGLACARLMMADNQKSFTEALTTWNEWVLLAQASPELRAVEDPLMIAPIVNEKIVFSDRSIPTEQSDQSNPNEQQDRSIPTEQVDAASQHLAFVTWRYLSLKNELTRVNKELAEAKKQSAEQQQTIETLQKDIANLKDQIKAIELIDQKIQEKKKAIPTTE